MDRPPSKQIKAMTLFQTKEQRSFRLSRSGGWVDLGNYNVNTLLLLKDIKLETTEESKVYVQLRGATGRPPIVNGTVSSIRAKKNEYKNNEVHWTVFNSATYNHTRSFATRFVNESDANRFLTLFNSNSTTTEVYELLQTEVNKIADDNESQSKAQEVDDEAEDSVNIDDDFNQCTQTWPEWHDINFPFD